ncbi:MAG: diguanylate cyclase domain-containing protein [Hyphomicrobiales bacterium]
MFKPFVVSSEGSLPSAVHRELVEIQFTTLTPVAIIGAGFIAFGALIGTRTGDVLLGGITMAGAVVAVARVALIWMYRRHSAARSSSLEEMQIWERRYAVGSFAFAALLRLFSARVFMLDNPLSQMLATGLLFGYGAGLVARVSVRPWICKPSLLLAYIPAIISVAANFDLAYLAHAALLGCFLIGSLESVSYLHRTTLAQLVTKRKLAGLARQDVLTGLPNRLQLRERLDDELASIGRAGGQFALHFVDLDRFKAVNDRYGHQVGDLLLKHVCRRLEGLLRESDIAARLGGDEFVVMQKGVAHRDEAEILARRIIRAIRAPYRIAERDIGIGASIGIALAPKNGLDADHLIAVADEALYLAKSRGGDCFVFCDEAAMQVGLAARSGMAAPPQS